jgi:uridine kinase
MDSLGIIREQVAVLCFQKQPVLIAIDGYGGSGKTTLARAIQTEFPGSEIVTLDDFARDTNEWRGQKTISISSTYAAL